MKYVVSWVPRPSATEETLARALQVFSKWSPREGATFKEFVSRVDGQGGFAVVETEDASLIMRDTAEFGAFFDFSVYPVLEIGEATMINTEAVAHLASID